MTVNDYMGYELIDKVRNKELTIQEIIDQTFKRIDEVENLLHSFVNFSLQKARKRAKQYDEKLARGKEVGSLCGLPVANKDLICVKDFPTTCCSKILNGYRPPYDAYVIKRLIENGAIHIGNTNMDEFAMGSSTETSCYEVTRNPWDLKRVPGGSSGGAAASVASGETVFALGSDTGGSIRCPASFCGVVGLKPTYGRVSRYGLIAFANSMDQIGSITKCVYDCALMLEIIAGKDPLDSTSVDVKVDAYTNELTKSIEKKIIGIPEEFFGKGINAEVKTSVKKAVNKLESLGALLVDVSIPHLEYAIPTYYLLCMSEASSNLARFDGLRYGEMIDEWNGDVYDVFSKTRGKFFGSEVKRRIYLGTYVLSAGYYDMFYIKALKVRNLIRQDFLKAFKECDFLVSPTMANAAFKIGEKINDPIEMYATDLLTCPVNLAGIPAISIPCGFSSNSLPIGIQFIGNYFDEKKLLSAAYSLEQELNIYRRRPPI